MTLKTDKLQCFQMYLLEEGRTAAFTRVPEVTSVQIYSVGLETRGDGKFSYIKVKGITYQ